MAGAPGGGTSGGPGGPGGPGTQSGQFAQDLERLEQIVRRLEGEDLELDEALRLFEEGVERLRAARERLGAAELRVRQVLADQAGKLRLEDLDR